MAKLSSLNGQFDESGTYNLKKYDQQFLKPLAGKVKVVQNHVKKVAKQFHSTIMVEGKWYDDCAAEFAKWWNDNGSAMDGVFLLNRISTIVEELVRITAVDVCKEMVSLKSMKKSASQYPYIVNFGKGSEYIYDIENITKKTLGDIPVTVCNANVKMEANKASLEAMIKAVASAFETINEQMESIGRLVNQHLIQGNTISFKGLNTTVLNNKISLGKKALNEIQYQLYKQLNEDKDNTNLTTKQLKSALQTDYTKGSGYFNGLVSTGSPSKKGSGAAGAAAAGAVAAGTTGWASPTSSGSSSSGKTSSNNTKKTVSSQATADGGRSTAANANTNTKKTVSSQATADGGRSTAANANKTNGTYAPGKNPYTSGGGGNYGGGQYAANPNAGKVTPRPDSIGGGKIDKNAPASNYNR